MIYGIVGLAGSGKTYWATKIAIEASREIRYNYGNKLIDVIKWQGEKALLKCLGKKIRSVNPIKEEYKTRGKNIYANYKIDVPGFRLVETFEDIYTVEPNSIVILDEVQTIMPSRYYDKLPPEMAIFIGRHRHHEVDLYWTSQTLSRADKILRENTNWIYEIKRILGSDTNCLISKKIKMLPEVAEIKNFEFLQEQKEKSKSEWFIIKDRICAKYDTLTMLDQLKK
ncbi:hypothetical protein KAI52_00580 [Candidatus Parcubacteria bacterium]|nr:hypothetical protein [Candidatus Parcubacteria bacterium]